MKKKIMKMKNVHGIVAMTLMCFIPMAGQAQMKNLLNKAGKAVEKTISSKTTEPATNSSSNGEESTFPTEQNMKFNPFGNYTPSKAAIKADPMASDNTVKKNYTKSPAQIRGAYEHLDKDLFPYQPYYDYSAAGLYLDGTQQNEDFIYYTTTQCRKMMDESFSKINGLEHNGTIGIGNTGKCVPYSEIVINAFFAEYLADPNSYIAYRQMIKAYILAHQQFLGRFRLTLDAGSQISVTNQSGKQTLFEPESERLKRNNKLMNIMVDVAMKSDYDIVFRGTYGSYTQAEKQYAAGNMDGALTNYREFVTSFDYFLTKHEGWKSDDRATDFENMYKEARVKMQKAQNAVIENSSDPIDMPKTYTVSAEIQNMAKQVVAREDSEHKNATIYFLSNGWRTLTRNGFITHRAVDVGWVYKDAKGQRWLCHGIMMQQAAYRGLTVIYLDGKYGMSGYGRTKLK